MHFQKQFKPPKDGCFALQRFTLAPRVAPFFIPLQWYEKANTRRNSLFQQVFYHKSKKIFENLKKFYKNA